MCKNTPDLCNISINVKTIGDLRKALKLLEDLPDSLILVTHNDDGECINITEINTHWHGALTFEHE